MDWRGNANAEEHEAALEEFRALLATNPDYTTAYKMAGQILLKMGKDGEAREMLQQGNNSASRGGNSHAKRKLEGLLDTPENA